MNVKAILCAAAAALALSGCVEETGGSTANKKMLVVNTSGKTMTRFYGSNAGTNSWEEDILGADVLPSGSSVTVDFEDGSGYCSFDFLAVFADGSQSVASGVDVCTATKVTF